MQLQGTHFQLEQERDQPWLCEYQQVDPHSHLAVEIMKHAYCTHLSSIISLTCCHINMCAQGQCVLKHEKIMNSAKIRTSVEPRVETNVSLIPGEMTFNE